MTAPELTEFDSLTPEEQARLRAAYALEMARHANTCSLDEKIARFNAWLEPQGITFSMDTLRPRHQAPMAR
ncbi:hypothetical protein [Celeribacter neptunius]|uniref:Uncharacterized protein n=1 Tax=Celeribacter neptunius TaxID=588602 RepID=A0A1I3VAA5_9RHOB|nr:hypothetical protein [Celeribacter neptunius]SFJ91933.1 hypothetical protein SAMN04487991_3269 [Celeribacter neptunius]